MTGDIFLLFYQCPGSGQDVFLGLALVFGQLLIEVPVGEQTSLEVGMLHSGMHTFAWLKRAM